LKAEGKTEGEKGEELKSLVEEMKEKYKDKVDIQSWIWMNCTATYNPQLKEFREKLEESVESVMKSFDVAIPDTSIPQKIVKGTTKTFYERSELEGFITKLIGRDAETSNNWIDTLIRTHDFFSVKLKGKGGKEKELICTDLERFGKGILSVLVEMSATQKKERTQMELRG